MADSTMTPVAKDFGVIPSDAQGTPEPLVIAFPQTELDDLHTLLAASRIGPETFESLQQDRKYGVSIQWLHVAKTTWLEDFDW